MSQRLAAVCDRHPEADMDAKSKLRNITKEGGLRRKKWRKKKTNTLYKGKGVRGVRKGGKEKSISFGASTRGHLLT